MVGRRTALGHGGTAGASNRGALLARVGVRDRRYSSNVLATVRRQYPCGATRRPDYPVAELPSDRRPAFISLYFEDVDHAGHDFGPDSPELTNAAVTVDKALGVLVEFIASHGLGDRATVVVVSDHGMTSLSDARTIWLDDFIDVTAVDITEADGVLLLAPRENSPARVAALFRRLKDAHPRLHVFTRDTLPKRLHYSKNPRIAPIIGIPDDGWTVTTRERRERRRAQGRLPQRGTHGYDPADRKYARALRRCRAGTETRGDCADSGERSPLRVPLQDLEGDARTKRR